MARLTQTRGLLSLIALGILSCGTDGTDGTETMPPAATCTDGTKNGTESDVDCGSGCGLCADSKACSTKADCASGVCTGNVCKAPTCTDGAKNASETDIDCGGSCGLCADGKSCTAGTGCTSGVCSSNVCRAPTCMDTVKNASETDVDCGGSCAACSFGKSCGGNMDCGSGICTSGKCRPAVSCAELLQTQPTTQSGVYTIDPDGYQMGKPQFLVQCDMSTEGGGWTRFNWVKAAFPIGQDPLGQTLDQCDPTGTNCRAKIPDGATFTEFMVKDVTANQYAAWKFDAANTTSNAVLGALRNQTKVCLSAGMVWAPYKNTGTRAYCGAGAEGGCKAFFYTDAVCNGKGNAGFGIELDGDTGCAAAAFKMGSTSVGCPNVNPMSGPADDYGFLTNFEYKQVFGELYYR